MSRFLLVLASAFILLIAAQASARSPQSSAKASKATSAGHVVEISTSLGKIVVQLFPKKAPKTVANFLRYVRSQHYNGTIFHRVIPTFMIQGGGMTATMVKKPTAKPVANEAYNGLKNRRGTLAMARTSDPHSATAQFFVNVKDNSFLDFKSRSPRGWGYCVFGEVKKGMSVVDKIRKVATTTRRGSANVPVKTVLIKKVRILR